MKRAPTVKTAEQVRMEFDRIGESFTHWAREHGFNPNLVFNVLQGRACKRGKSHEIAVLLGLKAGEVQARKTA
jgi:gp16 family phage-associated protein